MLGFLIALVLSNLLTLMHLVPDQVPRAQPDIRSDQFNSGPLKRRGYASARDRVTETDLLGTARITISWHPQFYLPTRVVAPITGGDRTAVLADGTEIAYPALNGQPAETLAFTYDDVSNGNFGKDLLTGFSDSSGNTQFKYDQYGRQVQKAQTVGTGTPKVLTTSYQDNGQIQGHTYPSGAEIRYTYRADGRVLTIAVNGVVVVREIEYHPMGPVKSWRYGTGNDRYEREFDRDGRIKEHTAGSATRTIGFDPASRITAISDGAGSQNRWTYGYDNLDRLSTAQNAATVGPIADLNLAWTYDPTGNRRSETRNQTPVVPYAIDPTSNKLAQVGTLARTYDQVGNTLNNGEGLSSTYNARNRLVQTSKPGISANYAHTAMGERVCKSASGTSCPSSANRTEYVYDSQGHLIGEYAQTLADQSEILWLEDAPIAVLKRRAGSSSGGPSGGGTTTPWAGTAAGGSEVLYIQPDHLHSPRIVVNAQNQPVWLWDSAPFGDTAPNEQPTAGLPNFTFNLRFPGQQYDRETGTHYNYFRDYEAATGRYVQSDPLGLASDSFATFSFVDSAPMDSVDNLGLRRSQIRQNQVRGNRYRDMVYRDAQRRCPSCRVEKEHYVRTPHGGRRIDVAIFKPGNTTDMPHIAVEVKCGRNARRDKSQLVKGNWMRTQGVRTIEHHRVSRRRR